MAEFRSVFSRMSFGICVAIFRLDGGFFSFSLSVVASLEVMMMLCDGGAAQFGELAGGPVNLFLLPSVAEMISGASAGLQAPSSAGTAFPSIARRIR